MVSLLTVFKAQTLLAEHVRRRRIDSGLTQQGLAARAGVPLPTLRKFEQKGLISLESFLKLAMVLGLLENIVNTTTPLVTQFNSIDEVINANKNKKPARQKGWRK